MIDTVPTLEFYEPTAADAAWAAPMLRATGSMACEYSFTTIFMWRRYYHNQIARFGAHLFVKTQEEKHAYLFPVGGDLREGIALLRAFAHDRGHPLCLFGEDERMVQQLEEWYPGVFTCEPSRGDFDYIYRSSDLIELPGKKYHGKRNHIAAFTRKFPWTYEAIDAQNTADVLAMAEEWCRQKGNCRDKGLRSEQCAIREALSLRRDLSLRGGLIRVEGRVVAFTFGSPINDQVFDVHVEKALPDFPGAYAVINREFAAHELADYPYINRENDLDIEGLRRAKESYYPAILLAKYVCTERV